MAFARVSLLDGTSAVGQRMEWRTSRIDVVCREVEMVVSA
jgi:hypothetical protein